MKKVFEDKEVVTPSASDLGQIDDLDSILVGQFLDALRSEEDELVEGVLLRCHLHYQLHCHLKNQISLTIKFGAELKKILRN